MIKMKDKIKIASCFGIRENTAAEIDFKSLLTNGQNLTFLTMQHDNGFNDEKFFENLKYCEKYNIPVLVYDCIINSKGMDITPDDVRKCTEPYKNSPVFIGAGFSDEPPMSDYPRLNCIARAYKEVYPDHMTMINLLPLYAANFVFGDNDYNEYIEEFAKQVDVDHICVDVYPFLLDNNKKYTYEEYLRAFDIQAQICRKYNRDFWMYIQSMEFLPNREPGLAEFRFQAYCALSFGATAILHFCYDVPTGSINADRTKRPVWSYSRTVNNELLAISDVYMKYENIGAFTHKPKNSPIYADFENEYRDFDAIYDIESDETLLLGCFESKHDSSEAFTLVNISELDDGHIADVEFKIKGNKKVTAYIKGITTVLNPVDDKYFVSLDSGEGIFVTVE